MTSARDAIDYANSRPAENVLIIPSMELKIGKHINLQLEHTFQQLDVDGGRLLEANLTSTRFVYQFNTRMFARAILQYRDIERDPDLYTFDVERQFEQLFTQLLFSYKVNAQTVIFAGYTDTRRGAAEFDLTQSDRTFFVKLGYAWIL